MVKEFTYSELEPIHKSENPEVDAYYFMWNYCWRILEKEPDVELVKLTLDGRGHNTGMGGKTYEFKRKPEDVKLRVNRD
jgi:hypothetical protein